MSSTVAPEQLARMRWFLEDEAGSSLQPATLRARPARPARRLTFAAVGAVAAGAVAVAVLSVGTTDPPKAGAIRVTSADGWTTVHLADPDSPAGDVISELRAAGFKVTVVNADGVDDCNLSTCVVGMFGASIPAVTRPNPPPGLFPGDRITPDFEAWTPEQRAWVERADRETLGIDSSASDPSTIRLRNDSRSVQVGVAPDREHSYNFVGHTTWPG